MKTKFFGRQAPKEQQGLLNEALRWQQRAAALDPDEPRRTAEKRAEQTPAPPKPGVSEAAERLRDLLEGLTPDDIRKLLEAEERRQADEEANRLAERERLLQSKAEQEAKAKRAEKRKELELELMDVEAEVSELAEQFTITRDNLLAIAASINNAVARHQVLHDRRNDTLAPDLPVGELGPRWQRPHIWDEKRHAVTLDQLKRA